MSWKLQLLTKENVRVEIEGVAFHLKPATSLKRGAVVAAWHNVQQVGGWKYIEDFVDALTSVVDSVEHPEFDHKNVRSFIRLMPPPVARALVEKIAEMTLDDYQIKNSDALHSGDSEGAMNLQESKAAVDVHSATEKDASA